MDYIRKLLIISIVLLYCLGKINGQVLPTDTALMNILIIKTDELQEYQSKQHYHIELFRKITSSFCFLNHNNIEKTTKLLSLSLNTNSVIPEVNRNDFFIKNYRCFDENQKREITGYLNTSLYPNAPRFHQLVSLYQLSSKSKYLTNKDLDLVFFRVRNYLKDMPYKNRINDELIRELKDVSTLVNLELGSEDYLIEQVNKLYFDFEGIRGEEIERYIHMFYRDILPNTIGILNSKNAMRKTCFYLSENRKSIFEYYDDAAPPTLGMQYFLLCVAPKLSNSEIELLAWMNFDKNKEEIKQRILLDDSIWLDYIK